MSAAPIHLAGERLMLDPEGALWWPARRLLVVADLHLEKGSALAARGTLVPPYDSRATLDRLIPLVRRYRPARLVALGDSFHDRHGAARLAREDTARLAALAQTLELVWVLGNHDPAPPDGLPGVATEALREGLLTFRHDATGQAGEISGHLHPKASVATRGKWVTRPCFVVDPRRVVLPAFGAYTGGLDVREPAIRALFPRGGRAFLLGRGRLYSFTLVELREAEPA
ncbi:ligase-associated DNA damage response endonuclease PdeM [Elioraea sp. Yellowstone]|jgi:DNA ligase-associated metallophosphoesterase|uniref:ligase-associated DNA damage response endonuclease PdeM n=1 Tax=Elioraea sp. Yellowstone TaxID=2592070 RepID=UPI001150064A|nr:ligase-associated DNA damage response endonuclease PdeM [Elioraea sp. Yellowstone]TQF81464.1 ligase-associated DNA damage response endonuclease PdeM [Elioraea sp. Yellowstone]